MVKYLTKRGGGASSEDKISPKKASKSATNCKTYSAVKQGYTCPKQCEFSTQNAQKNNAKLAVFESEKQRYKDCKVKSPNTYACKSDSSSKAKYLSIQRRNKLFVVGLFFFTFVFCLSAMFIAPNKMTPQTTTLNPVNAEVTTDDCGTNAKYTLDSVTGTLTISVKDGFTSGTIWDNVFQSQTNIVNVDIKDGITSIGNYVFDGCSSLTSITIPNSVTYIGDHVFDGTGYLNNFLNGTDDVLYNGVHLIKARDMTECTIDGNTKTIAGGAFRDCSGLTSITIPASVTNIGDAAFKGCTNLNNITIPASVKSIGDEAFDGTKYVSYALGSFGSIIYIGVHLIKANDATITKCTIKEGTKTIAGGAFKNCGKLTGIVIPDSVTSIGNFAFYNLRKLTSVKIGSSVTSIGDYAFSECNGLTSIEIPDSVTSIGDYAFSECNGLTSIEIPDSVTSIGIGAFSACYELTSVIIGSGVTSIGLVAFSGCGKLTSITIPNSVTSIGDYAFSECNGLTSIEIPDSVTSIGTDAFAECSADLTICGSSTTGSAAYNYAKNNSINYATAWVKKDSTTHMRTFYGFKTNSSATAETQTNSHNFVDGICSECGAIDGFSITLNVTTNVSRYFVIYVLDSNNQPIRQFAVTNGDNIVFTVAKSSAFTIQVYETLYMSATIGGTKTLKRTYTNLTGDTTIAIDISGVMNVNNWVMI